MVYLAVINALKDLRCLLSSPSTLSAPDLHTESRLVPAALTGDLRLEQIGIWVDNHKTNDYLLLEIFMLDIHVQLAKVKLRPLLQSRMRPGSVQLLTRIISMTSPLFNLLR